MIHRPSRRDTLKMAAKLAVASSLGVGDAAVARAKEPAGLGTDTFPHIDSMLRAATNAEEVPGVVALAATDKDIVYEGIFGRRRLHEGPAMTRDTVFRVASMIKPMTSVAALQLVERDKLSLDAPVPDIGPALGSPQVLDGFDAAGAPRLRPAKRPISLRHLLTHTAGFTYRLWDAKALQYFKAIDRLPSAARAQASRTPLMFDPGERWQYGTSIDWVGRIVESISGEPLDVYLRKHIFDPLGMNDTAFVISPQQRAREASVAQAAAGRAANNAASLLWWRWDLFYRTRLFDLHPHADARRLVRRRPHPSCRHRGTYGPEPDRQNRSRHP